VRFFGFVILLFIEVFEEIGVAVQLKMATTHFTRPERLRIIEFSSLSQGMNLARIFTRVVHILAGLIGPLRIVLYVVLDERIDILQFFEYFLFVLIVGDNELYFWFDAHF